MKAKLLLLCCTLLTVTHVFSIPTALTCDQCMTVVEEIAQFAGNETSIEKMIEKLDGDCQALGGDNFTTAICEDIVKGVISIFPWAEKELASLAWNSEAVCATVLKVCTIDCCLTNTQPEQIHLSLVGNDVTQMGVTWTTLLPTTTSTVTWGPYGPPPYSAQGITHTYTKGDWNGVIHNAIMTGLTANTTYYYIVGDQQGGFSEMLSFTTFAADIGANTPLRVLVIGDMGYDNTSTDTVNAMTNMAANNEVDMVIHNGDISYADGYMRHWDVFLRKVQPLASRVPYMVSPGNHEFWFNFTAYKARFFTPTTGSGDAMYYSWNTGTVHFVAMDTETQIDTANLDARQVKFIQTDLSNANRNRKQTPWIITFGHRPFYCSNRDKKDIECKQYAEILRSKVETTFLLNKVNLVLSAHLHGYERMWPVFNQKVTGHSYTNPTAPVYMVNGAAGNREGNENPPGDQPYSAFHSGDIGFALMTITTNNLVWNFYESANTTLIDSVTIII